MISESAVREELAKLADTMPLVDVIDGSLRAARRRRRRQALAASVSTIAVIGVGAGLPLSLKAGGHHTVVLALPADAAHGSQDGLDNAFHVAPSGASWGGPAILPQPNCKAEQIRVSAVTRSTSRGVVGVVSLRGHHCSLGALSATALIGRDGATLDVPAVPTPTSRNIGFGYGNGNAALVGKADLGFAWNGSWCGAAANAVRVSVAHEVIDVPLAGPQPTCAGTSHSELVAGTVNYPKQPVETAPAEWTALTAKLRISGPNTHHALHGVEVDFTNPTDKAIPLDPVPTYLIGVTDLHGDGTPGAAQQALPYAARQLIVPAHGTLRIQLPNVDLSQDADSFVTTTVNVTFTIAGVPWTKTTTEVPRT